MARHKKGYYIDGKYRENLSGWWSESERHSLASRGIKTGTPNSMFNQAFLWNEPVRKMKQKEFQNSDFDLDGVPNNKDPLPFLPADYRYKVEFAKSMIENQFNRGGEELLRHINQGKKGMIISIIPELILPKGIWFARSKKAYDFQDNNQEKIIHSGWDNGNSYRLVLEGTGDVFRELTKNSPDYSYVDEKLTRIERHIQDEITQVHPEDSYDYSYLNNTDKFKKMISLWERQPFKNNTQDLARRLNISMLTEDFSKAILLIKLIRKHFEKR